MKYQESVYKDFGYFLALAVEIVKDKLGLYNQLIDPPVRKKLMENSFQRFLAAVILILRRGGWYVYAAVTALLALGMLGFVGGMGGLLAVNPVMAASLAVFSGGGLYLLWRNRDVMVAQELIGKRYKADFDSICERYPDLEKRAPHVEKLMRQCVASLCTEVFNINSDEFIKRAQEDA